ncbi:MAG: NTP transferase domain-containing protein [Pirellulales bacterium]|nr:NTP transferase domain-containing protein [Pirellulales bacterium]
MLRTLGIVQACCHSGGSINELARRLGGKSVLEWVVRRVTDCQQLDGVIVLCGDTAADHAIRDLVPGDVPVLCSTAKDPLARFAAATEEYPTEAVVRVRADFPFVDPALIDRLVVTAESHPRCDYVSYSSRDGRPAILSPVGMYAEWFRTAAIRRAHRKATLPADRQEVTSYLYSHPEEFPLRLIPAPGRMDRDDVRLRVDMPEDWEHAQAIFEALGPEELDWQRIASLLDHQPALRRRMAALNRAHAES